MNKYNKIFNELENNINMADSVDNTKFREWSLNQFFIHKNRYKNDLETIENYYGKGDILEIGSYPYHLTFCLKSLGYPIIGLDLNPKRGEDFIRKHNLIIKKCDIEKQKIPFDDGRFELVLFNEILEHLRIDPISTLKEVNRIIKPNGIMVLTTPNLYSLRKIILFNLGNGFNDPYEEFEKLHTIGHMGHIREYSSKEVKKLLEKTGFNIINVRYKTYHNVKRKPAPIINLFYYFFPKWRPLQIIISKKI